MSSKNHPPVYGLRIFFLNHLSKFSSQAKSSSPLILNWKTDLIRIFPLNLSVQGFELGYRSQECSVEKVYFSSVDVYCVRAKNWTYVASALAFFVDWASSQKVVEAGHYEQLYDFWLCVELPFADCFDLSAFQKCGCEFSGVTFCFYPNSRCYLEPEGIA